MTDSSSVQAPAPGGCCAAGEGFERALGLLSDAAFKVFAHLCLRAARAGGTLEFERSQLAQQVGKSRSALGRCLQELVRAGVCRIDPAPNQHRRSRLRICAPFWPAAALAQTAAAEAGGAPPSAAASSSAAEYVASVRQAFLQPRCVQGRCNADDARLAQAWQRSGGCRWRRSGAPFCSAARASRWPCSASPERSRFAACTTSKRCSRRCSPRPIRGLTGSTCATTWSVASNAGRKLNAVPRRSLLARI